MFSTRKMNDEITSTHVVSINQDRCQGHSRCCTLAPELFESDEYGYAMVQGDGTVPVELLEKAHLALANCPEFAIVIRKNAE